MKVNEKDELRMVSIRMPVKLHNRAKSLASVSKQMGKRTDVTKMIVSGLQNEVTKLEEECLGKQ